MSCRRFLSESEPLMMKIYSITFLPRCDFFSFCSKFSVEFTFGKTVTLPNGQMICFD